MARHYSKFASVEEKRNLARARRFIFLTVTSLVLLFFFGLPLVIKFAAFLTDIRKSTVPIELGDTTPPAPPSLKNLPEATSESSITLEGTSEAGATVYIFLNEKESEVIANESGGFNLKVFLLDGENKLWARAKDAAGNESQKTQEHIIVFDDEPPALNITNPADGTQFSGSKNQKVKIEGTTESEANLTINQRFVSVRDDGTFSFEVTLAEGDNPFTILAEDAAGNQTEKNLTLKYSP